MEISSTKLVLYTMIATKLDVNSALQTVDTLIGIRSTPIFFPKHVVSSTNYYLSLRLKHVIETMLSLAIASWLSLYKHLFNYKQVNMNLWESVKCLTVRTVLMMMVLLNSSDWYTTETVGLLNCQCVLCFSLTHRDPWMTASPQLRLDSINSPELTKFL